MGFLTTHRNLTYSYPIGHTLDLQEKVVKDAMTPIERVSMLPLDTRLDYVTLRKVCESGHSYVPVYNEIEVPFYEQGNGKPDGRKAKKIVGILLVKQRVLDPKGLEPPKPSGECLAPLSMFSK